LFSGIIEAKSKVLNCRQLPDTLQISIEKPVQFDDLKTGDSIAVNGVCLTLEAQDNREIQFSLAQETLELTGWTPESLQSSGCEVNLERSMKLGDRIHGHIVSGHVESMGQVQQIQPLANTMIMSIKVPEKTLRYLWQKGSVTINGVSLTVNQVDRNEVSVCLIPETLERTNLGSLKEGDIVTLESDYMAKGLVKLFENGALNAKMENLAHE
jgi:riboflavin synthase